MAHCAGLLQGCGRRAVCVSDALAGIARHGRGLNPDTVANHVPGAANGVDERTVEALVDLRSQPRDMHVNNVGLRVEVIVPDMLEQHGAGHHLAGVLHQELEQAELARLKHDLGAITHHPMRQPVELEIADAISRRLARARGGAAAHQHLDPGEKLREGVRLGR